MTDDMDVWVDYNDVDEQGRVMTLRRFFLSEVDVTVGRRVRTGDHEGNRCQGTVVEIQPSGVVAIELDQATLVRARKHAPADR